VVAQVIEALRYKRKVAGSIPDCNTEIFYRHNSSDRTVVLGWTQPLTEISKRG
jgi:hypothetical protein